MSNIYLIGYRASGKTSVANELAKILDKKVIHMDKELVKRIGKIDVFVRNYGWNAFRDEETNLLKEISKEKNLIVDCGGGIIVRDVNIDLIKKGKCFWLKADVKTIQQRLKNDRNKRPSLTKNKSSVDEVNDLLKEREPSYKKAADYEIETENKALRDVVNEISRIIK